MDRGRAAIRVATATIIALAAVFGALGASAASAQTLSGYLLSDQALQRVTLGTGELDEVATLPVDRYAGLAFDADGSLWTLDVEQPALVSLSTFDGSVESTIPLTGLPELISPDLVFDACGRLWVSSTRVDDASLYSVDPQTGLAVFVGDTGVEVTSLTSRGRRLVALTYVEERRESRLVDLDPVDGAPFAGRDVEFSVPRAWIDFSANGSLWGVSPVLLVGPQVPGTIWTADSAGGARNVVSESSDLFAVRGFALAPTQGACTATECLTGAKRACVADDRYRITVDWQTEDESGAADVADAMSEDSAIFTFFDPENWEVMVKVLDGCGVNGFVWVYFAATTDVQFQLDVLDTETGFERSYVSAGGAPAETVTDSAAFPCSSPSSP